MAQEAKERVVTEEDLKSSVAEHVAGRARAIREKYGPVIDYPTLLEILEDRQEAVRYPVNIIFDSSRIDPGQFSFADEQHEEPDIPEGEDDDYHDYQMVLSEYNIVVHESLKERQDLLPAVVLYQLVVVNYGDLANAKDAEVFGSTILGVDCDVYYEQLCQIADSLPV